MLEAILTFWYSLAYNSKVHLQSARTAKFQVGVKKRLSKHWKSCFQKGFLFVELLGAVPSYKTRGLYG